MNLSGSYNDLDVDVLILQHADRDISPADTEQVTVGVCITAGDSHVAGSGSEGRLTCTERQGIKIRPKPETVVSKRLEMTQQLAAIFHKQQDATQSAPKNTVDQESTPWKKCITCTKPRPSTDFQKDSDVDNFCVNL
ncbi:uncharacterized protein E0L32_005673 [Thyridium curvatum]|uniref:Uncharacterized protein n=1 Tax=Thyridium curvatum TaxID=1093900 RepID=A0A507B271_9PEZI|nr:uncharacterized protein E0L32_005673 [Thyridium curvatum]TPX13973.1 hypothetical protein E0L32_005673 [Thyridium curvatum]